MLIYAMGKVDLKIFLPKSNVLDLATDKMQVFRHIIKCVSSVTDLALIC